MKVSAALVQLFTLFTLSIAYDNSDGSWKDVTTHLRRNLDEDGDSESSSTSSSTATTKPKTAPAAPKKSVTPVRKKGPTTGEPSKIPPKVFILGVQKGGSSSMMWMLITHPQLCSGERKETHFFTGIYEKLLDEGSSTQEIRADYLKLFKDTKCTQREDSSFIDGTPVMHRSQLASKNINEFYSKFSDEAKDQLKFIVMLREPVSRDNSWYEHSTRQYLTGHKTGKGFSDDRRGSIKDLKTFKELWWDDITAVKNGKKKRSAIGNEIGGDYVTQLKDFTKFFRRDQILVINSKMAFTKTKETMEIIRRFLGVEKWEAWETQPFPHDDHLGSTNNYDDPQCVFKHIPKMDCDMRDLLAKHYESTNKELYEWFEETKKNAPPMEPPFEPFGKAYQNLTCVEDSRAALNAVIKLDKKDTC